MRKDEERFTLELQSVEESSEEKEGGAGIWLQTDKGRIYGVFHQIPDHGRAVIWVGGAGGGVTGPAGGVYIRLAQQLAQKGIASLRLDYRYPNDTIACVLDTLVGVAYLESKEYEQVVAVGHSFGGAVVITAGVMSEAIRGVIALSSQTAATELAPDLSPKPLLLIHGQNDQVLPDTCSRNIYGRAGEPKQIILYPGCGHGLDECAEQLDRDITEFILKVLQPDAV